MKKQPTQEEILAALEQTSLNKKLRDAPLKEISLFVRSRFDFVTDSTQAMGLDEDAGFLFIVETDEEWEKRKRNGSIESINYLVRERVKKLDGFDAASEIINIRWVSQETLKRECNGNPFHY